jgi:hypothetical protein
VCQRCTPLTRCFRTVRCGQCCPKVSADMSVGHKRSLCLARKPNQAIANTPHTGILTLMDSDISHGDWSESQRLANDACMSSMQLRERLPTAGAISGMNVGMVTRRSPGSTGIDGADELCAVAASDIDATVCVGCLAKLFTATLIAQAVRVGLLNIDTDVTQQMTSLPRSARDVLAGISLRDLLNHTHGLDGSGIANPSRRADGRIDLEALCDSLAGVERLASIGEVYSYSNLGPWIAGALLEHRLAACYGKILTQWIIEPLAMEPLRPAQCATHAGDAVAACPATGGRLAVSLGGMLRFMGYHLGAPRDSVPGGFLRQHMAALPGWAIEVGIYRGWKCYEDGWMGHGADAKNCSATVRIHPQRGVGLIATAPNRSATMLLSRVFAHLLPKSASRVPWSEDERGSAKDVDLERYAGTYGNSARQVSITASPDSRLHLHSVPGKGRTAPVDLDLTWVRADTFVVGVHGAQGFGWVQFIQPGAQGFRFVWNGRNLWRRLPRVAGEARQIAS